MVYEGHDHPKDASCPNPKVVDQPEMLPSGKRTQNGKFHQAAQAFKAGRSSPERVRVYEKIKSGIWSYNGIFHLVDSWQERDDHRTVFKFRLIAVKGDDDLAEPVHIDAEWRRVIPTAVKLEVWKRDGGKCRLCEAEDELHFDHIVPFSRGGTSLTAENIQLLCARHNLQKRNHIE
ncbi:HNH endonuclease [Hydrocarboniphaga effusa]|uniref:HNH endonuclease n=1 Tax=Hydrocarboniphaga effusa TaxID=243629 RepID=UPI003BAB3535